jgi:hypothetical protein
LLGFSSIIDERKKIIKKIKILSNYTRLSPRSLPIMLATATIEVSLHTMLHFMAIEVGPRSSSHGWISINIVMVHGDKVNGDVLRERDRE